MYVPPKDEHADPLTQHLGELANRAATHYQAGNYIAAAFDLGEMQSFALEKFTDAWAAGIVDWLAGALDACERAAHTSCPHFRVTVDELPFDLGQTEPRCDCLRCSALASHAVTVDLEDAHRTSRCCTDHLEMVANVMLENMGSSIRLQNHIDVAADH